MAKFIRFPSIDQFRHVVKDVEQHFTYRGRDDDDKPIYDKSVVLPTLTFRGTVKLHGTNAGVGYTDAAGVWAQSRNQLLKIDAPDHFGFCAFVNENKETLKALCQSIPHEEDEAVCIFGEWCGGNVQKGVALTKLPKMFVIFGAIVKQGEEQRRWVPEADLKRLKSSDHHIYNIYDFDTFDVTIDFNDPEASQSVLTEITGKVEKQCPVGAALGAEGTGEGVVWHTHHETMGNVRFKVKGVKHAVTKTTKVAAVDPEKMASVQAFVDYAVTENRLNQAVEQVFKARGEDPSMKKMRDFLQWVVTDVFKEESDTLQESRLTQKDVTKAMQNAARKWFVAHCKQQR